MVAAMIYFVAALGVNVWMELSYANTMPKVPNPAAGRTQLIAVNHNTQVYVTAGEYRARTNAEYFFLVGDGICLALMIFLQKVYKVF